MTSFAIVTPSYRPDFENFRRLHESVRKHTDDSVIHHVIVPGRDAGIFRAVESPRLVVWTYQEMMPEGIHPTDRLAAWGRRLPALKSTLNCSAVNWRQPWKPIRGWVLQQIVKLAMVRRLEAEVLVYIDSDVVVARDLEMADFRRGDSTRFYSVGGAIDRGMERHYRWCQVAHELLGLTWAGEESYPDHVAGVIAWDRALACGVLDRIEEVTRRPWAVAVTRYLHFSEYILYGTFVRNFAAARDLEFVSEANQCHSYWEPEPMQHSQVAAFAEDFTADHVAVNFQSYSKTDDDVVSAVLERISRRTGRPTADHAPNFQPVKGNRE